MKDPPGKEKIPIAIILYKEEVADVQIYIS
jgi:hypothetical protein